MHTYIYIKYCIYMHLYLCIHILLMCQITMPNILHLLSHLILTRTLQSWFYCHPYITDEKLTLREVSVAYLQSHI